MSHAGVVFEHSGPAYIIGSAATTLYVLSRVVLAIGGGLFMGWMLRWRHKIVS